MLIIKSISFLIVFLILPIILGYFWVNKYSENKNNIVLSYVFGIIIMFSSFYVLVIPFTFLKYSLNLLLIFWAFIIICLIILTIVKMRLNVFILIKEKIFGLFMNRDSKGVKILLLIFMAMLFFQVFFVCINSHVDEDDAWYVGTAVTSYFDNSINSLNPYTGFPMELSLAADYILSPLPVFWAMIGKVFFLHPTIIMHTLSPAILILFAYAVYYLIGRVIFKEENKKLIIFLIFVGIINIWGNQSIRSTSTFLLFRIWQGKAVLASILIPLIGYCLIKTNETYNSKNTKILYYMILFCATISSCMVSSMGIILCPILLGCYMVVQIFINKSIKNIRYYFVCILPCLILLCANFIFLR